MEKYHLEMIKKVQQLLIFIREIILYCIFAWISFIVCYSKIDSNAFNYKTRIQNLFEFFLVHFLQTRLKIAKNVIKHSQLPNLCTAHE